MSQRERHAPPNSIALKCNTSGYQPQQGTDPSTRQSGTNYEKEGGGGGRCGCATGTGGRPLNNASSSPHSPQEDHGSPSCVNRERAHTGPEQNHNFSNRLKFTRHDTVGYTDCDGHGQIWCDGRHWTPRSHADSQRPLSPGSSAVAMKTLLDNVARVEDFDQEEIGCGFFSTVYKVTHKKTKQELVLKLNNKESSFASIVQEIQLLKKLQHPNIIKLLGVCVHEGNIHALIEYMNCGSLSSILLDESLHLSWMARIGLAKDIASGMSYLHMHSVMHRDLTSMNCLIKKSSNGSMHAVVADLGLAARISRFAEKLQSVGTPFWMSPENLRGKFYNEKTDLFSFGIILCEIIARVTANPDELPRLHDFGLNMEAFRLMSGNCPEQFLLVAFSCCNMEPSKRPAFTDVVLSLRNIEADLTRQNQRLPSLPSGRLRSQSTVIAPHQLRTSPEAKPTLGRSPRNSIIRSNSDSGSRPHKVCVSKKWVNPFDTPHLKNGQTKLIERSSSMALSELPAEVLDLLQAMLQEDEDEEAEIAKEEAERCPRQRSMSLPNSPVIQRLQLGSGKNTNYIHSSSDITDGMSAADRRKTLSPGFVTPEWLEERRAGRGRSRTTSEVACLNSDPGLGALVEDKLGLGSPQRQIIESSEDG